MVDYGVLLLQLTIKLKSEFPKVKSPQYVGDGSAAGTLKKYFFIFKRLCEIGPDYGYVPEESKSVLIVRSKNNKGRIFQKKHNYDFVIKNGY